MLDRSSLRSLELDLLFEYVADDCATLLGREWVDRLQPAPSVEEAIRASLRTKEWVTRDETGSELVIGNIGDPGSVLDSLAKEGVVLTGEEIACVHQLVRCLADCVRFLGRDSEALNQLARAPLPSALS